MDISGKTLISNIRKLIDKGLYKDAYKYSTENNPIEEKHKNSIQCFRLLLSCITKRGNLNHNDFNWGIKGNNNQISGVDFTGIESQIRCQDDMFDELRVMCKKKMNL